MNTLNKIKNWITTKELYKTLTDYGILSSLLLTFMTCWIFSDIAINTDLEIVEIKSVLIFLIISLTVNNLMFISGGSNKIKLFIPFCNKYSKVIQTLIVITFFEALYILSYTPKMMIPEGVMESILIALPAFKFCVFIYVVTLNRIAQRGEENV